jgi:hypothetical protein
MGSSMTQPALKRRAVYTIFDVLNFIKAGVAGRAAHCSVRKFLDKIT